MSLVQPLLSMGDGVRFERDFRAVIANRALSVHG